MTFIYGRIFIYFGFVINLLNRIFSSGQVFAFNELMRRVQPMQDVKAVRDEVKVRKIERLSGKTVAVSNRFKEYVIFLSLFHDNSTQ